MSHEIFKCCDERVAAEVVTDHSGIVQTAIKKVNLEGSDQKRTGKCTKNEIRVDDHMTGNISCQRCQESPYHSYCNVAAY